MLTFTIPIEGLSPRHIILANWIQSLIDTAPVEFAQIDTEEFILALVGIYKIDLEEVLNSCLGKTDEIRQ